jgi:phosphoglucomutase
MRTKPEIDAEYARWLEHTEDGELLEQLKSMDDAAKEDAFYQDLAFGTAGLRGVLGAGTNRMNRYTVAKASQGLANYVLAHFDHPAVAVSYDSRHQSDRFAETACAVFAANGIRVHLYRELMPTPCLSWAVRALDCSAGVMVTASHNPAQYNGYKVYGPDGCQITTQAAEAILGEIEGLDLFRDVQSMDFSEALASGLVRYISQETEDAFNGKVLEQSVLFGDEVKRDAAIVYSPLNGTGRKPVLQVLGEAGFTNVTVVKEQELPDGDFPTCPYPNPEIREAMALGLEYCKKLGADLLLATDPDCDRCGIAVREGEEYRLLTGNEVGLLLLDFICAQRQRHGKMPPDPVFVKTIVTTDLAEKIAAHYGVRTVNVLTGFKFIGEVIGRLEAEGRADSFLLGFEESYGYLTGPYVRDKDAVDAALMICEMFAWYKSRGSSLPRRLEELYRTYGYCLNTVYSFSFPGSAGMEEMAKRMADFRQGPEAWGGERIEKTLDYAGGLNGLPPAEVLKSFTRSASVVIRPSGTEPKLKAYISVTAPDRAAAQALEQRIAGEVKARI